jgi:hypothetical protein
VPCKVLLDFAVARHWLRDFRGGILMPVMSAAVTDENTAKFLDLLDEVAVFHASSSSA